jgi:hypothetical protein
VPAVPSDPGTNTTVRQDPDPISTDMMVTDASTPNEPSRTCNISPVNLGHECAIRASGPQFLARKRPFVPISRPKRALWAWIRLGGALHWLLKGPALLPGEDQMGNVRLS